jgi:hypothetical protein
MESLRLYRGIFYFGAGWNFLASVPTFLLVSSLPSMLQIEPPLYPLFIYFNLMTVFLFGCLHIVVARSMSSSRSLVVVIAWSKFLTALIFVGGLVFLSMPQPLIEFLAPGMALDLLLGAAFWRYLIFSKPEVPA